MQKTPSNNTTLQNPHNIYENQQKEKPPAKNSHHVLQVKGHFQNAPSAAYQPAPLSNRGGARAVKTKKTNTQKSNTQRGKLVHTTIHLEPRVHIEMSRLAENQGLSFSQVGNIACRTYVNATIEKQHGEALRDIIRQIIREELAAFGHRIIHYLRLIAFSSEQAKLLATNVLKFVLKLSGLDQKAYHTLVDESGKLARRNVLTNTPQFKDHLEQEASANTEQGRGDGKEAE